MKCEPTLMAAEIAEQPAALRKTLDALLPLRGELRALAGGSREVIFVARGSSDNAAIYGRYLLEVHAGRRAALAAPSVATHYRADLDLSDVLVVSVSQSGVTHEIVETQEWARSCGARTLAVTNVDGSALAQNADLALVTQAGPERAVPATKTYTAQLVAMAVLGCALAADADALGRDLAGVPDEFERLLDERSGVDEAVEALAGAEQVLVSGRGLVLGTALEVALKLEETCGRYVRGLSYADLRHGPIAVAGPGLVAVLVAAADWPLLGGMLDVAHDLTARGASTLTLGGGPELAAASTWHLPGPRLPEAVAPLALAGPGQLVVEALARRVGLDPDVPHGMSKVTLTDRTDLRGGRVVEARRAG